MQSSRVKVAGLAAVFFATGVLAAPVAFASVSNSSWDFQSSAGGACTWGRAQVDNVNKFSRSQTASRIRVGAPPGCTSMSGTASSAVAGHLRGTAYLVRTSNDDVCAAAGPATNGVATGLLQVTANLFGGPGCPAANGTQYHSFTISQRWTGSAYDGNTADISPSLPFN